MELDNIKNRVFPTLKEDVNWNAFLDEVCNCCDKTLFTYLRQNEIKQRTFIETSSFNTVLIGSKPEKRSHVLGVDVLNKSVSYDGAIKQLFNNVILYNDKYDKFEVSNSLSLDRGTYVLILDRNGNVVDDLLVDTYSPSTLGFSLNLVYRASDIVCNFIKEYLETDTLMIFWSINKSSITESLADVLSSLKIEVESSIQLERTYSFIVDLKHYNDGSYYTETSINVPVYNKLCVADKSDILDIRVFTASLSEVSESYDKVYELVKPSSERHLLIAGADINGIETEINQVIGNYGEFIPTNLEFGVRTKDNLIRVSDKQAAELLAASVGGIFVVIFENDSHKVLIAFNTTISDNVLPSGIYSLTGAVTPKFSNELNISEVHTEVFTTLNKIGIVNKSYSPNSFVGPYIKLFGTEVFDIYSLWSLYQANALLGGTIDDIDIQYTDQGDNNIYTIKGLKILEISGNYGTGYSPILLVPSKGRNKGDIICGELRYRYLAKINDTDKLIEVESKINVRLLISSYNKGFFTFETSKEDSEALETMLSKELIGDIVCTLQRNVSGFSKGSSFKDILVEGDYKEELKGWFNRSIPVTKLQGVVKWSFVINKRLIQATSVGVIDSYSAINVWGNDSFYIDTKQFPNWYNIIIDEGVLDEEGIWHAVAPTVIRSEFDFNNTGVIRNFKFKVVGTHGSVYEIDVVQSNKDTVDPVVIYNGIRTTVKQGESKKINESKSGFICKIELITQLGGYLVCDDWIKLSSSEGPFSDPINVTIDEFVTEEEVFRKGSVSLYLDGGVVYSDFIQIIQTVSDDKLKTDLVIDANVTDTSIVWNSVPKVNSRNDLIWIIAASKLTKLVEHPYIKPLYVPQWPATITTNNEYQPILPDLPDFLEDKEKVVSLDDSRTIAIDIVEYDPQYGSVFVETKDIKGVNKFTAGSSLVSGSKFIDDFLSIDWNYKEGFYGKIDKNIQSEFLDLDGEGIFMLTGGIVSDTSIAEVSNTGLEVTIKNNRSGVIYLALGYFTDERYQTSPDVNIWGNKEGTTVDVVKSPFKIDKDDSERFKVIRVPYDSNKFSSITIGTQDYNLIVAGITFVSTEYDEGVMLIRDWQDHYTPALHGYVGQEFRVKATSNDGYRVKDGYPLVYTDNTQEDEIDYNNVWNKVIEKNTAGAVVESWSELYPNLGIHFVPNGTQISTMESSVTNTIQILQLKVSTKVTGFVRFTLTKLKGGESSYKVDSDSWKYFNNFIQVGCTLTKGEHIILFRYERNYPESTGGLTIEGLKFEANTGKRELELLRVDSGWSYYSLPEYNNVIVNVSFEYGVSDPRNLLEFPRPISNPSLKWPWNKFDNYCSQHSEFRTSEYALVGRGTSELSKGYVNIFRSTEDNISNTGVVIMTIPITDDEKKVVADSIIKSSDDPIFIQELGGAGELEKLRDWGYLIEESSENISFNNGE